MKVEEINSVVPELPEPAPMVDRGLPSPGKQGFPPDAEVTLSGQLTLNGVTAYFEIKDGKKVVCSLVDNATGRVLRQFSPAEGMGILVAIDEILAQQATNRDADGKGQ